MEKRKRTSWFIDPSRIRAVKAAAAVMDMDSSQVVDAAIAEYLKNHGFPQRKSAVRARRHRAAALGGKPHAAKSA